MLSFNFFKAQNELGLKGQIQSRARTKSGSLQTKSVGFSGSVSSRFRTKRRDFFPTNRVFQTDHDEDSFFPFFCESSFKFETKRLKWKKKKVKSHLSKDFHFDRIEAARVRTKKRLNPIKQKPDWIIISVGFQQKLREHCERETELGQNARLRFEAVLITRLEKCCVWCWSTWEQEHFCHSHFHSDFVTLSLL